MKHYLGTMGNPCFDEKRQVGTCVQPALIMVIVVFAVFALCVDVSKGGVLFNELAAWCHVLAHEHGEDIVGLCGIV